VDPATGARSLVSANDSPPGGPEFFNPEAVTLAPDGSLLAVDSDAFADSGGGVIRVDQSSGMRTPVAANGAPAGGPDFRDPRRLAVDPSGAFLVADSAALANRGGGVIRVDPRTGARTAVSGNGAPSVGPSFVKPSGIAVIPVPQQPGADPGDPGDPGGGPVRDTTAPFFTRPLRVAPPAFKVRSGARLRYSLSEPATVTFRVERVAMGRRVRGVCKRRTRGDRKGRACTRHVPLRGSFRHPSMLGANSFRFDGRLRGRKLAVSRYRLVAVARDAAGNASKAALASFRIVR
jgi:hypothetical protein